MNTLTELTPNELLRRRLIVFFKGWIISNAQENGMKWSSTRTSDSKEFEQGRQLVKQNLCVSRMVTTIMHIVYSRLRKGKPHLGTKQKDDSMVSVFGHRCSCEFAFITKLFGPEWREVYNV